MPPIEAKLRQNAVKPFMKPDNPFQYLTDKDMLIFNPNYEAYINKLNKNSSKVSELSRIISQPFNGKEKKKKQELALYAFMRTTGKGTQPQSKLESQ